MLIHLDVVPAGELSEWEYPPFSGEIADGRIQSITPGSAGPPANLPANARTIDLQGYTALPGLVGMHNHMFFPMGGPPPMYSNMGVSFPRLYLALGVTTIRTTGSVAPFTDLEIKRLIDAGRMDQGARVASWRCSSTSSTCSPRRPTAATA